MRITLTLHDPSARRSTDVLLDAPDDLPLRRVLPLLARASGALDGGAAYVGRRLLDPDRTLAAGDLVEGGVVSVDAPSRWRDDDADVDEDDRLPLTAVPGGYAVARPPRLPPAARAAPVVRLPAPPAAPTRRPLPWLVALVPLLGSLAIAGLAHNLTFLLFGLLSPLALMASTVNDRWSDRRRHKQAMAAYSAAREAARASEAAVAAEETARRRSALPDPGTLLSIARRPGRRLWERRRSNADAWLLRVGTGTLPAAYAVEQPRGDPPLTHPRLSGVPVAVDLSEVGVLGVSGPSHAVRGSAAWLLAQAVTLRPPQDLQVLVLAEASASAAWAWVRWLPHARPVLGQEAEALVAVGAEAVARRVGELLALVERRVESREAARAGGGGERREPDVLVVVDGARRLRSLPGVAALLRDGPSVGVMAICTEDDERGLPEECGAVAALGGEGAERSLRLTLRDADAVDTVRPDLVDTDWADALARALAPLRDATPDEEDAGLPASARLLDQLGLDPPTPAAVLEHWERTGRSTRAVLGVGPDGDFAVDLAVDGPHALVAGTTGAGKSELLQTLVASLAVANRPDALAFVLIDYKGGAAFRECAELPHVVGLVTDLDGALVERALASLRAELAARERALAAAGARDLDDHIRKVAAGVAAGPLLPRLLVVVDEFAALARELPEFVSGLVDLAQRGRSLGISLVLATQRPTGAVSPEIRANASLRLGLRMSDAGESTDVLDSPDAARIPRTVPGRAYARLGPGCLVPFQTARVGGPRPGARSGAHTDAYAVALPLGALARRALPPADAAGAGSVHEVATDLAALVAAVRGAAASGRLPAPRRPWLPPLPDVVDDLGAGALGLADLPDRQEQAAYVLKLADLQHLLVVGAPRSGRSTTLRAAALSLAAQATSAELHLHVLDCGAGGELAPLTGLPHLGAYVTRTEADRAGRLLDRLCEELRERQRSPGDGRPRVVLLLDGWEGFTAGLAELDGGRLLDAVLLLLREGPGAGISLLVAGDRALLAGRVGAAIPARLLLRLSDPADYALGGLSPRTLPAGGLPPGRVLPVGLPGLDARAGHAVQVALRAAARASPCGVDARSGPRPFRVDALPAAIGFAAAWAHRPEQLPPLWALLGVGGDQLTALGVRLDDASGTFVIAGPRRSGRSTALLAVAESLLRRRVPLVVVAPPRSPVATLAGHPGVIALTDPGADALAHALLDAPGLLEPRNGHDGEKGGRGVLLVDDAETLRDAPCREVLHAALRAAAGGGPPVVMAGDPEELCTGFSGWPAELRRARRGLLLSPQNPTDGDSVGVRLPRSAVGQPLDPGRGLLHDGGGSLVAVRVPLSEGLSTSCG